MKDSTTFIFIGCLVVLFSCSTLKKDEPSIGTPTLNTANAKMGQELFMERCQKCHPGGETGLGPSLINKNLPGLLIRFQVRHGLGTMPAFSKKEISKKDLRGIILYLKELRKARNIPRE